MQFEEYVIGKQYPKFIGRGDGTLMDLDDSGMIFIALFNKPTVAEINQFNENKPFQMGLIQIQDIIFGLFKLGNLNWMDAPYNVHLSKNLTTKIKIPKNETETIGLLTTILLIDTSTGRLCNRRIIGLSNNISRIFLKMAEEQYKKPFSKANHLKTINNIYKTYSTEKLVEMTPDAYRYSLR